MISDVERSNRKLDENCLLVFVVLSLRRAVANFVLRLRSHATRNAAMALAVVAV